MEVNRIRFTLLQGLGEVDIDRIGLALVFQFCVAQQDLLNLKDIAEIDLNPRTVLQHLELDRILAGNRFLLWIDSDIEVVVEQVVVGALRAIAAAELIAFVRSNHRTIAAALATPPTFAARRGAAFTFATYAFSAGGLASRALAALGRRRLRFLA